MVFESPIMVGLSLRHLDGGDVEKASCLGKARCLRRTSSRAVCTVDNVVHAF